MEDNYYDYTFNITLVGDCGVGKTNIGSMFVDNEFISDHWFTLGVLIKNKIIKLDNSIIKLKILCTSSNEEFRSESLMHYIRGGQCIFVVFDLTKLETFTNIHIWLHEIKKYNDDAIIFIIGTKEDLKKERQVLPSMLTDIKEQYTYFEVSSLTRYNINEVLKTMTSEIIAFKNKKYEANKIITTFGCISATYMILDGLFTIVNY